MGNTFPISGGGVDAVEGVYGDGRAPAVRRSAAGRRSDERGLSRVRHFAQDRLQDLRAPQSLNQREEGDDAQPSCRGDRRVIEAEAYLPGTDGSNPFRPSEESCELQYRRRSDPHSKGRVSHQPHSSCPSGWRRPMPSRRLFDAVTPTRPKRRSMSSAPMACALGKKFKRRSAFEGGRKAVEPTALPPTIARAQARWCR